MNEENQIEFNFSDTDSSTSNPQIRTISATDFQETDSTDSDTVLAQLISLGFDLSVSQFAIYENKGLGFEATLKWLLEQQHGSNALYSEEGQLEETLQEKLEPYRRSVSLAPPPKKGILKPPSQSNKGSVWKRDWLNTLNTRLQTVANSPYSGTSSTTSSFLSNALKRFSTEVSASDSPIHDSNSPLPTDDNLLTPAALKRVRFPIMNLTKEYPHSPTPDDDVNENLDGEYDFEEQDEKQDEQQQDQVELNTVYTPQQMLQFYLAACRAREEPPVNQLVETFRRASYPNRSLHTIDLRGCFLEGKPIEPIADILTLNCGLQQLILERCYIDDSTLKIICHSLLVTDTLPYLSIANNKRIKSNGFNYIGVYVKKSETLKYLDLSGIQIDKKAATFLAQALVQGSTKSGAVLEALKLEGCGLKNNVLEILGPGIRKSNLHYLSLRFNHINHLGAVWIGVMLRDYDDSVYEPGNATLLAFNEQGEDRTEEHKRRRRGLEALDLTGNELKSGISYIAQALRRNRSLKDLLLLENRLDPKDLVSFSEGLKHNNTLSLLDLSRNPLGGPSAEGITALRNALTVNKGLKALFLSDVQLSSEGAIALAEYLPETKSLSHLGITNNPAIDIAGIMALDASLKINHSVRWLDVNVPTNDIEMARLSQDILHSCVRNAEFVQDEGEVVERVTLINHYETKFSPLPDQPIPQQGIPVLLETVNKDIEIVKENVKLFEEIMANEKERKDGEKTDADEIIEQLYTQCQEFQAKIRSYITGATEEKLLEELLLLNDRLSSALETYKQMYKCAVTITTPHNTHLDSTVSETSASSNAQTSLTSPNIPSSSPLSATSPLSEVTAFSIGGESDSGDDEPLANIAAQISPQHQTTPQKNPIVNLNKSLETEEGEVLRKAKEMIDEIESSERSPLDQFSGEELRTQILEEPKDT